MSSNTTSTTRPSTFTQDIHVACQKHTTPSPHRRGALSNISETQKKTNSLRVIPQHRPSPPAKSQAHASTKTHALPSAPRGTDHATPALSHSTPPYIIKPTNTSNAPSHTQNTNSVIPGTTNSEGVETRGSDRSSCSDGVRRGIIHKHHLRRKLRRTTLTRINYSIQLMMHLMMHLKPDQEWFHLLFPSKWRHVLQVPPTV